MSDLPLIKDAEVDDDGVLKIRWINGGEHTFHSVWLRDNCPCSRCRHPLTQELILDQSAVLVNIRPAEVASGSASLRVKWRDEDHESIYENSWLYGVHEISNSPRQQQTRNWSKNRKIPQAFRYELVLSDEGALLDWLRTLRDDGIAMIEGAPLRPNVVREIANRVAFVLPTNFGETFDVLSKPSPTSNAYTALGLEPHTDLPHHDVPPGYQLLHCIEHSSIGGESVFVDGFALAEELRSENQDVFNRLTTRPISFRFQDDNHDHRYHGPMIALDVGGEIACVRHAPNVVAPLAVAFDEVLRLRAAYQMFLQMTRDPERQSRLRLKPGDLLATDNHRVLHGRTSFDPKTGMRRLQGCYLDRSELLSKIRVLERVVNGDGVDSLSSEMWSSK